ncbi:MAG: folate-binding protein YgfZ, partial [Akkermansiaceae bacterium]|nr:folate-binding protein YgfZ [Armatimonadota bacterium]
MLPELFYTPTKRDLLKLTGKDRQSFLQGMVTNDVLKLQPGEGCYALMLDATAHVLADMHILNVGDYLLLDLEPGMAPFVAETLDKYLIMEKCRITDVTASFGCFVIGGERAGDYLRNNNSVADAGTWKDNQNAMLPDDCVLSRVNVASIPLYRLYFPDPRNMDVAYMPRNEKGDTEAELPEASLDALRIEAGIPRFGVDMDKTVLAPEVRQDSRAVSYKKGCYIGQEIVARIDARGHTNKGLVGFLPDPSQAVLPEKDVPVFAS